MSAIDGLLSIHEPPEHPICSSALFLTSSWTSSLSSVGIRFQRTAQLLGFLIQQVAGLVEVKDFHAEATGRLQLTTDWVVLILQLTTTSVMDIGELTGSVATVLTLEQSGLAGMAAQQLFLQTPDRIPGLGLHQHVVLVAHHLMLVEGHSEQYNQLLRRRHHPRQA